MEMDDAVRERFEATPVNRTLGLCLRRSDPDGSEVALAELDELIQEERIVHGGVLATLADAAAVYAVLPSLPAGRTLTSIEFKLNFLAAARADGGCLVACGRVVKVGRRIAVAEADVVQAECAIARGTFTYLLYDSDA
jgi:uncharacterized protein (TIGR00369 family)